MEIAALITALGVFAAFVAGFYLAKTLLNSEIQRSTNEIQRLTQQNADLVGSLYHRIGYAPQLNHDKQEPRTEPDVEDARVAAAKSHGYVDFFELRQQAFERESNLKRMTS
jgi:hypothetical protein